MELFAGRGAFAGGHGAGARHRAAHRHFAGHHARARNGAAELCGSSVPTDRGRRADFDFAHSA